MEVGWRLARQAWHQGYATGAATAAVDVAFNAAGLTDPGHPLRRHVIFRMARSSATRPDQEDGAHDGD